MSVSGAKKKKRTREDALIFDDDDNDAAAADAGFSANASANVSANAKCSSNNNNDDDDDNDDNDDNDDDNDSDDYSDDDDYDDKSSASLITKPAALTPASAPTPDLSKPLNISDPNYMVFRTIHPERLLAILNTIKNIVAWASISFTRNGFCIRALDVSKTSMVSIHVNGDALHGGYYACTHDYTVTVNIAALYTRLKVARDAPVMEMLITGALTPDKIYLSWTGKLPCSQMAFCLSCDTETQADLMISTCEFKHTVGIPSVLWRKMLVNFKKQTMVMRLRKNRDRMRIEFDDVHGDTCLDFGPQFDNTTIWQENDEELNHQYRIGPLVAGTKITRHTETVMIYVNNAKDGLLAVKYVIIGLGEFSIYMAPRVGDY